MGRYLLILLGPAFLCLLVAPPLTLWAANTCLTGEQTCLLVRYQVDKAAHLPKNVDTVFLGDSSLGYAVDAAHFAELRARPAANLALTGANFGPPGVYNMLAHVVARAVPRNLVVMLTPETYMAGGDDTYETDPAFRGVVHTLFGRSDLLRDSLEDYPWPIARRLGKLAFDSAFLAAALRIGRPMDDLQELKASDYPPQRKIGDIATMAATRLGSPTRRYEASLRRIGRQCRELGINCLYMHGPMLDQVAGASAATAAEIAGMARAAGLRVVNDTAIPIAEHEIGDSVNHVRPEYKTEYTRRIHRMLEPHLTP